MPPLVIASRMLVACWVNSWDLLHNVSCASLASAGVNEQGAATTEVGVSVSDEPSGADGTGLVGGLAFDGAGGCGGVIKSGVV